MNSSDRPAGLSEGTLALCKAASKVRGGAWVEGAPTHIFAEMHLALERDGWQLLRRAAVSPVSVEGEDERKIEMRRWGDEMQSEASRLAEAVDFDSLPYEARMAILRLSEAASPSSPTGQVSHDWIICRDCCEAWPYDERAERSCECDEDHTFRVAEVPDAR